MLLGLALAFLLGVVWTVRALTHPPRRGPGWALARGKPTMPGELDRALEVRVWGLTHGGVTLPVWECRGRRATGPTVVVTHGWGDSRFTMLPRVDRLADVASRVIVWDLPGHGEAPGTCGLGTREAGALVQLMQEASEGGRVVLYGFSLGAGVTLEAAARSPELVDGVIAEAPYRLAVTPARNVIRSTGMPWRWNVPAAFAWLGWRLGVGAAWRGFDRAAWAARVGEARVKGPNPEGVPLLVIHGERDEVCPLADGREIAVAGGGTLVVVPEAGHLDLWDEPAATATWGAVERFLGG